MPKKYIFFSKINRRGFTLVEMIVSVGLFTVAMAMALTAIIGMVDANRNTQALKSVMNNLNVVMESISRDIKFGTTYYCSTATLVPDFGTYGDCLNGKLISYTSNKGEQVVYRFFGNAIERLDVNRWIPMTAPEVVVENVQFFVYGADHMPVDGRQPRVFLVISGHAGLKPSVQSRFNVQATISQRTPDY